MKRRNLYVNWALIQRCSYRKLYFNGAFHWVTDASIEDCLQRGHLEDVSRGSKLGGRYHHAARIASLVTILQKETFLRPIHIHVGQNNRIKVEDGNHRLRAYQYLNRGHTIPAFVTGNWKLIRDTRKVAR